MLFARKLLLQDQQRFIDQVWTAPGNYTVALPAGIYDIIIHGGGGAGGEDNPVPAGVITWRQPGKGGAGGKGERIVRGFQLTAPGFVSFSVGAGGIIYSAGGNGGANATSGGRDSAGGVASVGGGGGGRASMLYGIVNGTVRNYSAWRPANGDIIYTSDATAFVVGDNIRVYTLTEIRNPNSPSFGYVANVTSATSLTLAGTTYTRDRAQDLYETSQNTILATNFVTAQGGGGGGGAGQQPTSGRYTGGSGGGGGGGYYYETPSSFSSFGGATGAAGAMSGANGIAGSSGWEVSSYGFIYAGDSGSGYEHHGAVGGVGRGASGAGGGGGKRNDDSYEGRPGGGGGGGAGGCADAGGGSAAHGTPTGPDWIDSEAQDGYNFHTTPTPTTDPYGNSQSSGWGTGGTTATNGSAGWVYIKRIV